MDQESNTAKSGGHTSRILCHPIVDDARLNDSNTKASARFDHNCFSNGCTQYFSLSAKFEEISATDCPPGTIHSKNEICGGYGYMDKKNWRKIWPKNGLKWPKNA